MSCYDREKHQINIEREEFERNYDKACDLSRELLNYNKNIEERRIVILNDIKKLVDTKIDNIENGNEQNNSQENWSSTK